MSDVFESVDPTPGYRYDTASGRWVPDVPAAVPSAQLEPELRWTPDVAPFVRCDSMEPRYGKLQCVFRAGHDAQHACGDIDWAAPNPYAPGSIWHTSWGYDQTNVEFLQVMRESKASVWLVPMASEIHDGRQWPTTTTGIATPKMHRKPRGNGGYAHAYLRIDDVRSAWPYNGGGCYSTAASGGAGH